MCLRIDRSGGRGRALVTRLVSLLRKSVTSSGGMVGVATVLPSQTSEGRTPGPAGALNTSGVGILTLAPSPSRNALNRQAADLGAQRHPQSRGHRNDTTAAPR